MKFLRLLFSALLVAITLPYGTEASSANRITGERIPFEDPPRWTNSGAWDEDGNLLLVDVLRSQVRRYDRTGHPIGLVDDSFARSKGREDPTLIQNDQTGAVWVEYEDGYLLKLNSQLKVERELDLVEAKGPQGALIALFWWTTLGDSELLAFGDIQRGKSITGAVLRIPIAAPSKFTILQEVPAESPAHRFFLIGQSFLANISGRPYYLVMGKSPYVVKPDGGRFTFVQVGKAGRIPFERPELPLRVTIETTSLLFRQLERTAAPAGLYGWNGFLYVLMRTPLQGMTTWNLMKIDPATSKIIWNREARYVRQPFSSGSW